MAGMVIPLRGDIFWVNLDPTVGSEIRKKRPAVIISNDAANKRYDQVTVIPLTSQKLDAVEPFQVFLSAEDSGLSKDSKALAEQIRTVSKRRLESRAGRINTIFMAKLEAALKIHLDLE
ncbi:MAG: type II toxin-antitoxin system PemK/MazF family toxin [Deltaproteobacteria bacterium]|nr:type II toxin-antitoxin system PemK/MazF family toxin [Deltaproteobacteria bacterium]